MWELYYRIKEDANKKVHFKTFHSDKNFIVVRITMPIKKVWFYFFSAITIPTIIIAPPTSNNSVGISPSQRIAKGTLKRGIK